MFLEPDGKPLPFDTAVLSGRATGVPGAVKMLGLAHDEHGKLAVEQPVRRCRAHGRRGLHRQPAPRPHDPRRLRREPRARRLAYFSKPDGQPAQCRRPAAQPGLCRFLRRLAAQGPAALYAGSTAAKIVARTRAGPLGGSMTMADLADYRPIKREPVCGPYRIYLLVRAAAAVERSRARSS